MVVTGQPGSGKTTLGRALAAALRVPFLARDEIRGGMVASAGLWSGRLDGAPPREDAIAVLVEVVETLTSHGVSAVLELVVTPERRAAFRRIEAVADAVVVHTTARNSAERAGARDRQDSMLNRPEVLRALGHESIDGYLAGPERRRIATEAQTDLGAPLLEVVTDDGFDPPLEDVVEWVIDQVRSRRKAPD